MTIVKNDPNSLFDTYKSVIDSELQGLSISTWLIKLSSSNDNSLDRIFELPPYAVVCTISDTSIYDGFNVALSELSKIDKLNNYTMLLNAGDLLLPSSSRLFNGIVNNNDDFDAIIFSAQTSCGRLIKPIQKIIGVGGLNFCHQAVVFKLDLLIDRPFSNEYKIAGDYHQFISMGPLNKLIVDFPIVNYSLDGLSEQSIIRTRYDNFRAGYSVYGFNEVIRVLKMYFIRVLDKVIR